MRPGGKALVKRRSILGNREELPKVMKSSSSNENGGTDGGFVSVRLTLSAAGDVGGSGISSILRVQGGRGDGDRGAGSCHS